MGFARVVEPSVGRETLPAPVVVPLVLEAETHTAVSMPEEASERQDAVMEVPMLKIGAS